VDFERTLETQRLRLLRLVAGLVLLIGFLSVGPVSRGFSVAICRYVGSVLSRAEMAARYLVIAQAHRMVALGAFQGQRSQISESLAHAFVKTHADVSPSECQRRLKALRALLLDLPARDARICLRRTRRRLFSHRCSIGGWLRIASSARRFRLAPVLILSSDLHTLLPNRNEGRRYAYWSFRR